MNSHPDAKRVAPEEGTAPEAPDDSVRERTLDEAGPEIEALRTDLERFQDLAFRSQADLENFRKRVAREKEELAKYANATLLDRLLPVLDSFELGLATARQTPGAEPIANGFAMVEKQLHDFLRDSGVEQIDASGSPFDPNFHEAVSHLPDPNTPAGIVSRQLRKGYKLRDRLLRPATVVVSSGIQNPQPPSGTHP